MARFDRYDWHGQTEISRDTRYNSRISGSVVAIVLSILVENGFIVIDVAFLSPAILL